MDNHQPQLGFVYNMGGKIEDLSLPMQGAIVAKGDDSEMWNNLDGCEEWGVFETLEEAIESLSS